MYLKTSDFYYKIASEIVVKTYKVYNLAIYFNSFFSGQKIKFVSVVYDWITKRLFRTPHLLTKRFERFTFPLINNFRIYIYHS